MGFGAGTEVFVRLRREPSREVGRLLFDLMEEFMARQLYKAMAV